MYTNEDISRILFYEGEYDFYTCYWYKPGVLRNDLTLEQARELSQGSLYRTVNEERLEEELGELEAKVSRYRNFRELLETDIPEMFGIYPPRGCINRAILDLENGRTKLEIAADIKNEILKDYPSKPLWIDSLEEVPTLVTAYKKSIIVAMTKKTLPAIHKKEVDSMLDDLGVIVRLTPELGLGWFFERLNSIRLRVSNIFYYVIQQNLAKIERRIILLLTTYFVPKGCLLGEYRQHYQVVYPSIEAEIGENQEVEELVKEMKSLQTIKCHCMRDDKVVVKFSFGYVEFCTYGMSQKMIDWKIRYEVYCHYKKVKNKIVKIENVAERMKEWMKNNTPKDVVQRIPYVLSDYYDVVIGDRDKGNSAQIDPSLYKRLELMGYDREGFAAPFNHTLAKWYSLSPLDRFLGSRGSFFDEMNEGKFLLNPPYELYVVEKMLLSLQEGSQYIIFLPDKDKVRELIVTLGKSVKLVIPKSKVKMRQFWEKERNYGDSKIFNPVNDVLVMLEGLGIEEENSILKLLLSDEDI